MVKLSSGMQSITIPMQQTQDVESMLVQRWSTVFDVGPTLNYHWFNVLCLLGGHLDASLLVQAVGGFSVHFWKKLQFFAQMISNMYTFDPDIAQSILTRLTPN